MFNFQCVSTTFVLIYFSLIEIISLSFDLITLHYVFPSLYHITACHYKRDAYLSHGRHHVFMYLYMNLYFTNTVMMCSLFSLINYIQLMYLLQYSLIFSYSLIYNVPLIIQTLSNCFVIIGPYKMICFRIVSSCCTNFIFLYLECDS